MEKFTGREGLSAREIADLKRCYNNPCINLLLGMCNLPNNQYPKKCHPPVAIFFRSIRKKICPAISIAPKVLWSSILRFISDFNSIDDLVSSVFLYNIKSSFRWI